jgi:phosphoribosylaminoimidazole-succinocarboxamide synthase
MKEYQETGQVCGIPLPPGLKEADKLPEPIFTPSTKAEIGEHDVNITYQEMEKLVGSEVAQFLKETSLKIYKKASEYAESRGIIIADTKFEFGIYEDKIILVDEVLTPDSSRFWPKDEYQPGKPQKSFDKQFIRDWLKSISWDPQNPPTIPEDIVLKTREKYLEALYRLTGKTL